MCIKPVEVERDENGMWTHPGFPEWDENVPAKEMGEWWKANDATYFIDMFEDTAPEKMVDNWFDHGEHDCSGWNPSCDKEGAFLLSIHDTEDGPVAVFLVPNPTIVVSDEYVNKLFEGTNFGDVINNCVTEKRKQIHKTLTDLVAGSWSGHTAYHIVLNGGFIKDGKRSTPKELTALGTAFMSQFNEFN